MKKNIKEYERKIADALAKYHFKKDDRVYKFVSRPDEKYKGSFKLPDFEYYDQKNNATLLIELSRITPKKADRLTSLYRGFLSLKNDLDGNLQGIFALLIDYDAIPQKKTKKLRNKNKYFHALKEKILEISTELVVHRNNQIDEGVTILKQDDSGSLLWLYPLYFHSLWTEDPKIMIKLLKDAEEKFNNYRKGNCKNILLLIHVGLQVLRNDISILLNDIKAWIHDKGKDSFSIFTGHFYFYILFLDIDWNQDITVSRLYPYPMSDGLCNLSDIFKDQKEYWQFLDKYFPG